MKCKRLGMYNAQAFSFSAHANCNVFHSFEELTNPPMFTVDQIKAAHSKVKSGADFPNYIQDLIKLGLIHYETFVTDGHSDYYGKDNYKTSSTSKYDNLVVAPEANAEQFKADLKIHQQGKTDYPTFCKDCARSGVDRWIVDFVKMTCTYYDQSGNELLTEKIPG